MTKEQMIANWVAMKARLNTPAETKTKVEVARKRQEKRDESVFNYLHK